MLIQLSRSFSDQKIIVNSEKINMIEPSRAQHVGSIIRMDAETFEVKERPNEILALIDKGERS